MNYSDSHVRWLTPGDDQNYSDFLDRLSADNPAVLGYHYPFYRDAMLLINIGTPKYAGFFDAGILRGVLPGFQTRADVGSVYCSLPFFGPNGGVLCEDNACTEIIHSVLISFVLEEFSREKNPITASFYSSFLFERFSYYRINIAPLVVTYRSTQMMEIDERIWDSKIRYDIRRAQNAGITISEECNEMNIEMLYNIYFENCRDYGIPVKPKIVIDALANWKNATDHVCFYFALFEGRIIGGLIGVYSPSTLSYYLPCTKDSFRTLQPGTLLVDYAYQKARKKGIKYWNWESSPNIDSGVYKFKKKWGSTPVEYQIFTYRFADKSIIQKLGREGLLKEFPYYFVYPFQEL